MSKTGKGIRKDSLSAIILLALSLFICFSALATLSYGHYYLPGPGFLPFWSGMLLGLLSLALLIQSIMNKRKSEKESILGQWEKPLFIFSILVGYALFFRILGHFLNNLFFITIILLFVERKKWLTALGGGIIAAVGFYFIFSVWLKVPLPAGVF